MTLNGPRKRCPTCQKSMRRWGKTNNGKQRWRCPTCQTSAIRKRKDNRDRKRLSLFLSWLTSKETASQAAKRTRRCRRTLERWGRPFFHHPPEQLPPELPIRVLVLDGTSASPRRCVILIAADADASCPVSWVPVPRECAASWRAFLVPMKRSGVEPSVVVCDGQRGLLKAIAETWPTARVQRCLIHVCRQAISWTTKRPKTKAGQELLMLIRALPHVRTRRQKRRWVQSFRYWKRRHHRFLAERTYGTNGRWWHTHRKLRAVRSLITNAVPDLFRFVSDPTIPRTSNHVEGGLNARLKELFRCHRGMSLQQKIALAAWYLHVRQKRRKTTRNVT